MIRAIVHSEGQHEKKLRGQTNVHPHRKNEPGKCNPVRPSDLQACCPGGARRNGAAPVVASTVARGPVCSMVVSSCVLFVFTFPAAASSLWGTVMAALTLFLY
jgi:hypothetical protein